MVRIAEPPEYITARLPCKFKGFNNIIQFDYLLQKFNEAKEEYFKYVLEEGGYKALVKKILKINIEKYEDYRKIDDKLVAGYTYETVYSIVKDKQFATTVGMLVLWTLKGLNALKDKLKELGYKEEAEALPSENEVEFSYWNFIACVGAVEKGTKGNRKIKLRPNSKTIDILNSLGSNISGVYKFRGRLGREFRKIFENEIWKDKLGYFAKVVRLHENWKTETLHCQVHVSVPFNVYAKYAELRIRAPRLCTGLVAGADINADRINVAIIRAKDLRLIDYKTFWLDELNSKGYPRERARQLISYRLREMYLWLMKKNVDYIAFEDYELLGQWKLIDCLRGEKLRSSEANWRKFTFRSSIIEEATLVAIRMGFPLPVLIHPAGTTQIAKELVPIMGTDIHAASAYVIASLAILEQENN